MRPLALLVCLLAALSAPPAALGSDVEVERLELELSQRVGQQVEQRIDRALRDALDGALRAPVLAAPAGLDPAAPSPRAAGVEESDAAGRPARMRCRPSTAYALECVVVTTRPGLARIARTR